jgi:glucose/arabinose dehydrogenase
VSIRALLLSLLLLNCSLIGCLSEEEDEDTGFEWQEKVEIPCNIDLREDLVCKEYLTGFETPIASIHHPSEEEIWIADLSGVISAWDGVELRTVANFSSIVSRCHIEQGLLSFAFEENFNSTQTVLLSYVETGQCEGPNDSSLILADSKVVNGTIDVSSVRILREISQPYRNHNGGHLIGIGNQQYLWGLGDGGGSNSPFKNSQNLSSPLGAIHLMEYSNGTVNPVSNATDTNPYILHSGVRNPWRFDLDPNNGLWITDVGQNCFEEVNYVPLNESKNLGWSVNEGFNQFSATEECGSTPLNSDSNYTDPVVTYPHEGGNCSISGGEWMDWGAPALRDGYLYGDFCTGSIWLTKADGTSWDTELIAQSGTMIVGFGHSLNDDLLIFSWAGIIYVLEEKQS